MALSVLSTYGQLFLFLFANIYFSVKLLTLHRFTMSLKKKILFRPYRGCPGLEHGCTTLVYGLCLVLRLVSIEGNMWKDVVVSLEESCHVFFLILDNPFKALCA